MKKRYFWWIALFLYVCLSGASSAAAYSGSPVSEDAAAKKLLGACIPFIENRGQLQDPLTKFYLRGPGGSVFYRQNGSVQYHARAGKKKAIFSETFMGMYKPDLKAVTPSATRVSFFAGNRPDKWKTGLPTYRDIAIDNLYPGISVQFRAKGSSIEDIYSLEDPGKTHRIRVSVDGAQKLGTDAAGNLFIDTAVGRFLKSKPVAYQTIDGIRKQVACRYVVSGKTYGFKTEGWAPGHPLVIDPDIQWSTFVGGTGSDKVHDMVIDSSGSIYAVGETMSEDFPGPTGYDGREASDSVLVFKMAPGGSSLEWAAFLAGSGTGFLDVGYGIAVGGSGAVYITGATNSEDFPTTSGSFSSEHNGDVDAFVCKIAAGGGSLDWGTFLGGTGWDEGHAVSVGSSGDVIVTGMVKAYQTEEVYLGTPGAYDIIPNGDWDVFVAKLSATGDQLKWATLVGGSQSDVPADVAFTGGGVVVSGITFSDDFPTTGGAHDTTHGENYDGFVLKLDENASSLSWSTFIGGNAPESMGPMVLDASGNIYITGETSSDDFPTTAGVYKDTLQPTDDGYVSSDAFVTKISTGGSVQWSTFLGGKSSSENGSGIALDSSGNICVAGETYSEDFPTTAGAHQREITTDYGPDVFVAKLSSDATSLQYGSYVGGEDYEWSAGIAVDGSDDFIVAGTTDSTDFPTTAGALSRTHSDGRYDAFVFKLSPKGTGGLPGSGGGDDDCASEEALDDSSQLNVLRKLREVRMKSASGKELAALYYRSSSGIVEVLKRNPKLKAELRQLLIRNMPVFKKLIAGEPAVISNTMRDRITTLLAKLAAAGDPGLRMNVQKVMRGIKSKQLLKEFGVIVQ